MPEEAIGAMRKARKLTAYRKSMKWLNRKKGEINEFNHKGYTWMYVHVLDMSLKIKDGIVKKAWKGSWRYHKTLLTIYIAEILPIDFEKTAPITGLTNKLIKYFIKHLNVTFGVSRRDHTIKKIWIGQG
jgi:hypothetical protein